MAKLNATYKCYICGNVVKVIEEGAGDLVCCGENMSLTEDVQGLKNAEEE